MQTIAITGYKRPALFQKLIESLLRNDLKGWEIEIQIEPSEFSGECVSIAKGLLASHKHNVTVNSERLGVRQNPFSLLSRIFTNGAEDVIYLEEDLLLSPDVTQLAKWFKNNFKKNWLCLSLITGGCGSFGFLSYPVYENLLFRSKAFNSLGFVLNKFSWEKHFCDQWMNDDPRSRHYSGAKAYGWDWSIFNYVSRTPDLYCLSPVTARSTHIGREGGEFCTAEFHDLAFQDMPIAKRPYSVDYTLLDVKALPGPARRHALMWQQLIDTMLATSSAMTRFEVGGDWKNIKPFNIKEGLRDLYAMPPDLEPTDESRTTLARKHLERLNVPDRLDGLRVLVIAPMSGLIDFECVRRGAKEVVSLDRGARDFDDYKRECESLGITNTARVSLNIYEITAEKLGIFDIVLCLGTIYQLRHPLLALERIHAVTRSALYLDSAISGTIISEKAIPAEHRGKLFTRGRDVELTPTVYFSEDAAQEGTVDGLIPNAAALKRYLTVTGFQIRQYFDDGASASIVATKMVA